MIIGGVLFGLLAGYNYWFPKAFGFTLDERFGKASFWCWIVGFYLAFTPLYVLGLMGDDPAPAAHSPTRAGSRCCSSPRLGAVVILLRHSLPDRAALCQHPHARAAPRLDRRSVERPHPGMGDRLAAAGVQLRGAAQSRDDRRVLGDEAAAGSAAVQPVYEPIEMPRNSPIGFVIAFFASVTGFALIWHIWWMAILGRFRCRGRGAGVRLERRSRARTLGRRNRTIERARMSLGQTA